MPLGRLLLLISKKPEASLFPSRVSRLCRKRHITEAGRIWRFAATNSSPEGGLQTLRETTHHRSRAILEIRRYEHYILTIIKQFIFLLLLASASNSFAGVITPGLEEYYRTRSESEFAPVLIFIAAGLRAPIEAERLERAGVSLAEIHRQLIDQLKSTTHDGQSAVLASLEIMVANKQARAVKPFWVANLIAAELTKSGAALIANTADVLEIGLDPAIQLVPPVYSTSSFSQSVRAPDRGGFQNLWQQGIDGRNRIVCVMGESFRPQHEALAASYHGNFAAPEIAFYDPLPIRTEQYCGDHTNRMIGVICGGTGVESIGVAPAAHWIGAGMFVCGKSKLSTFISSLEWALDPDRRSETFGDVPDAILCPWTWEALCYGAAPTNITDVFENAEALGPVLIFAANNSTAENSAFVGPGSFESLLTVGNLEVHSSIAQVHPSSARGPSGCDPRSIKPDLVAVGTDVFTSSPDAESGFTTSTGTAIAAASVAGTVALIRQKFPNLNAIKVKQALVQSATDLGPAGPDMQFGHGELHAELALTSAGQLGATGELQIVVRYGGTGIPDARVVAVSPSGAFYAQTNDGGVAKFDQIPAAQNYQIYVGRFGYQSFAEADSIFIVPKKLTDVFITMTRGYHDDGEFDQGWQFGISADNASGGEWIRAEPVPTFAGGTPVQPAKAFDGTRCFVTANGTDGSEAGQSDVDAGMTTMRSPEFSLIELSNPILTFRYWYSNDLGPNRGGDFFRAQLSNDGGLSWVNLINSSTSTNGWEIATVNLESIAKLTGRMMLQFVAEDQGAGSLVEAAVDNIEITGDPIAPEPPRNLLIDVQFDQVVLSWRPSRGATQYKIYVSENPDAIISPDHFLFSTPDTTATVPLSTIHYENFYFSVTATN